MKLGWVQVKGTCWGFTRIHSSFVLCSLCQLKGGLFFPQWIMNSNAYILLSALQTQTEKLMQRYHIMCFHLTSHNFSKWHSPSKKKRKGRKAPTSGILFFEGRQLKQVFNKENMWSIIRTIKKHKSWYKVTELQKSQRFLVNLFSQVQTPKWKQELTAIF